MAADSTGNAGPGHVHFPVDQLEKHDAEIVILSNADDQQDIHLGFLQILHRYHINFSIKDDLGENITSDPLENLHVSLVEANPTDSGDGHSLVVEFKAFKEKLMDEKISLYNIEKTKKLSLVFHARVLGKGKGTPALRRGIHCVGVEMDEDSEVSDWQGFN